MFGHLRVVDKVKIDPNFDRGSGEMKLLNSVADLMFRI